MTEVQKSRENSKREKKPTRKTSQKDRSAKHINDIENEDSEINGSIHENTDSYKLAINNEVEYESSKFKQLNDNREDMTPKNGQIGDITSIPNSQKSISKIGKSSNRKKKDDSKTDSNTNTKPPSFNNLEELESTNQIKKSQKKKITKRQKKESGDNDSQVNLSLKDNKNVEKSKFYDDEKKNDGPNHALDENFEKKITSKPNLKYSVEKLEESIQEFSKFVEKPSEDESPRTSQSFFFSQKDKKKGILESQRLLSAYRLKKIKKAHEPVDYDKLKEREAAYLSTMMIKKEVQKDNMKKEIKSRESAFKVSFKSKTHDKVGQELKQLRNNTKIRHDEGVRHRTLSKKYGEKINQMNHLENVNIEKMLKDKYPSEGIEMRHWFYGRFGTNVWNAENNYANSKGYMKNKQTVGDNYQEYGNSQANKSQSKDRVAKIKLQESQKEEELLKMVKTREKSHDNLRHSRKRLLHRSFNDSTENSLPLKSNLDVKRYQSRDQRPMDDLKKELCLNRIKTFDKRAEMKEDRLRFGAETRIPSLDTSFNDNNNENKPSRLEDFYIESIRAKLDLLNEIEASGARVDYQVLEQLF